MAIEYRGKRDLRFVAAHRGGQLDIARHRLLSIWAADCAELVLPLFTEKFPEDDRPSKAIAVGRAWSRGEATVGEARKAAFAAHAAAKGLVDTSAREVARSAGHAVSTAHMADHALVAAAYAIKAVRMASGISEVMTTVNFACLLTREHLPEEIRELVLSSMELDWLLLGD